MSLRLKQQEKGCPVPLMDFITILDDFPDIGTVG
jgi:hypothetical protein